MAYERITTKADYLRFRECDRIALRIPDKRRHPRPFLDDIWRYEILLRKVEYHTASGGIANRFLGIIEKLRFKRLGVKLGFTVDPFVFGPGLSIAHYGSLTVNPHARIGSNCRIHEGVTIGATNGSDLAPVIGDNCFIGSGAKVIGGITIGDDVAIGAGAVVIKNCAENSVSLGGVPAKVISHNGSALNIVNATEAYKRREGL